MPKIVYVLMISVGSFLTGCFEGDPGARGPAGLDGKDGVQGPPGMDGMPGAPGMDVAVSGTRLLGQWMTGSDGSSAFIGWFDSTTNQTCSYAKASDDVVRCLPAGVGLSVYYLDSICTDAIAVIFDSMTAPPPPPEYVRVGAPIPRYVQIGGFIADPPAIYVEQMLGSCALVNGPNWADIYAYDATILPPSYFVEGTVETK